MRFHWWGSPHTHTPTHTDPWWSVPRIMWKSVLYQRPPSLSTRHWRSIWALHWISITQRGCTVWQHHRLGTRRLSILPIHGLCVCVCVSGTQAAVLNSPQLTFPFPHLEAATSDSVGCCLRVDGLHLRHPPHLRLIDMWGFLWNVAPINVTFYVQLCVCEQCAETA